MDIKPISNVSFGLNVKIDPKILKKATKTEYDEIIELQRDLRGVRLDEDVFFRAVEGPNRDVVNVAHMEGDLPLPRLYPYGDKHPFTIGDFIKYLREKLDWYELRFQGDRALEEGLGI